MRKSEKKGPNSKFPRCPIFKFFVVTRELICQKMAPILDPVIFLGFQPYKSLWPKSLNAMAYSSLSSSARQPSAMFYWSRSSLVILKPNKIVTHNAMASSSPSPSSSTRQPSALFVLRQPLFVANTRTVTLFSKIFSFTLCKVFLTKY